MQFQRVPTNVQRARERETDRQTDRQTQTQTDTDRQADKQLWCLYKEGDGGVLERISKSQRLTDRQTDREPWTALVSVQRRRWRRTHQADPDSPAV